MQLSDFISASDGGIANDALPWIFGFLVIAFIAVNIFLPKRGPR